jgi:hypothetical protein
VAIDDDDAWIEATHVGHERQQRRRGAALTVQQRLEWLEGQLRAAERSGALADIRASTQQALVKAWGELG